MPRRLCALLFLLIIVSAAHAHDSAVYRINAGGPSFTDSLGRVWTADSNFNTGNVYSVANAIAGTVDDPLFQTERWDAATAPELQYSLPVANGKYTVNLYFAENYSLNQAVGKRVFDVFMEGQLAYDNLDIFQLAGANTALILSKDVNVSDSSLTISFGHVADSPKISAIEVIANEPPTAVASALPSTGSAPLSTNFTGSNSTDEDGTIASYSWDFGDGQNANSANPSHVYQNPGTYVATLTVEDDDGASSQQAVQVNVTTVAATAVYRINAGGTAFTDSSGNAWTADKLYNTGSTYSVTTAIAGTVDDKLFQSERWDGATAPDLQYSLPVSNGNYRVNLYFAENYVPNQVVGNRVFDVLIEGQVAFNDLDIFQQAGASTALILSKDVSVTDGTLNISFGRVVENPKINAIEVLTGTGTPTNQPPTAVASANPASGWAPLAVAFTGSNSTDSDGTISSYAWNFGDGQTATTANPSHTYQNTGNYTATLTVTDNGNLTSSKTVPISVTPSPTTAVFRVNAGGTAFTDSLGHVWSADSNFNTGNTFSVTNAISGTTDDKLYQSERYDPATAPDLVYSFPVTNGTYRVNLHFAEIYNLNQAVGKRVFDVFIEGQLAFDNVDIFQQAGGYTPLVLTKDVNVSDGTLNISFGRIVESPKISAIEILGSGTGGSHDMHSVIVVEPYTVDYDGNGSENVALKGSDSHTHEVGKSIVAYEWSENGTVFSTTANLTKSFAVGSHTIQLKITDNSTPPKTDTATATFKVAAKNNVPGALALYYESGTPGSLLDSVPATANYGVVENQFEIALQNAVIGGTPYTGNVMVRLFGAVNINTAGQYTFQAAGGSDRRLFVDGALASGPISLGTGKHQVEARFAITATTQLPLTVTYALNTAAQGPIDPAVITHDETTLKPVINTAPSSGAGAGGEQVTITGLGFFPAAQTTVHWGTQNLSGASLTVTPKSISLISPPGSGTINVTVETPNGVSDASTYNYTTSSAVNFTYSDLTTMNAPTQADWGPDGRLYVGSLDGTINAYTFDDNYTVTNVQTISTIAGLSNPNILGITFNPFDPPGAVKIYVAHGLIYAQGGGCFTGPSPYTGQVSVLTGPSFSTAQPLITKLPVSNHDHAVNGMQFDNNGDLLIANGGNTNAGVQDCAIGDLPESPLSAAILRAKTSKGASFNGNINYVNSGTTTINNDQVSGGSVDVQSGVDVQVFAHGFRNPWDLVFTTKGFIFNSENGPNTGFGPTSTSATTQTTDAQDNDELNLTEYGNYYGHPNRNRGRYDARQNVYRSGSAANIPAIFNQKLATFVPSTDGITEYRANTFGGALRGNLFAQKWSSTTYKIVLGADGKSVTNNSSFTTSLSTLDIVASPGGALIGTDYTNNKLKIAKANDTTGAMTIFDIFPWRAPKAGGKSFVIGGKNFSGTTTVTIGGASATVTSVSATRIKGTLPANASAPASLVDVVVTSNGQTSTLTQAFRYLSTAGSEPIPDRWVTGSPMPVSLGEVAGGVIGTKLYLVGENNSATLSYDLASGTWSSTTALAQRPLVGNHHGAEVFNGKLYLIGGFGGGSEGKVQIYNPATNSWTTGANMPFATGSPATALINGQIYVAGGIVNGATTNLAAKYNPTTNAWTSIAPMPVGRNHAASNTDGTKLYVFGGRDGANVPSNGFNDTQIYNPSTNTWQSSSQAGSTLAPLPQARGGMGKAVYYKGEFYVIGGETSTGAGATAQKVYTRVDIYNPATNAWRLGAAMPTGRHGIFPLLHGWRIYVPGGGTQAGFSNSNINQIYIP